MPSIKLTQVNKAGQLLKKLVDKADLNDDKAIRESDIAKLTEHARTHGEFGPLASTLDSLRGSARKKGGPSLSNIKKVIDDATKKIASYDKDADGKLSNEEQGRRMTVGESQLLGFALAAKNKKVSDYKFPAKHEWQPGHFSWRGTAEQVCNSLLNAYSKPANDNFFPHWGESEPGTPRASRFGVDGNEAKTMVTALKELYVSRQKSVLTELARRTQASEYGCVNPNEAATKVFKKYAEELGLDLTWGHPAAPHVII